jgi:hypothetical protein
MSIERGWFVASICVAMVLMTSGWVAILHRQRRGRTTVAPSTLAGGVTVTVLLLLVYVVPWRIVYSVRHERVDLDTNRCYIVGERPGDLLLYCPDINPPKMRIARADDQHVRRVNAVESIYTAPH